ncbi:MAG TPA: hypothetical protein VFL69_01680 [Marmoricola sp.]|nr:hypothetical protein [Marmoricola sp.]
MSRSRPRLSSLPCAWAVVLALVMLGPALGPGYVLSYDMVWVPHLAMRSDFLGLGSALPRAVPSDAVVAALGWVVPQVLLQKVVLVGPLLAAAIGMMRLVGPSLVARLVVVTLSVWNPFTVERLAIGHWTVLLGYGVLPWLVLAGLRARRTGSVPLGTLLLVAVGSLSASAGLVSAAALLVSGAAVRTRADIARTLRLLAVVVAANAPWLVAGALHAGAAERAGGTRVFALHGEGSLPAPLAALSLGGIWNTQVVPDSRQTFLAWLLLLLLAGLAALGARVWWVRAGRDLGVRLLVLWGVGSGLACLTWLAPDLVAWVAAHLPGGGLLRDGSRVLGLCLPVFAGVPAIGAEVLARRLGGRDRAVRALVAVACTVLPVALLYDAGWGIGGALRPTHFPASWAEARQRVTGVPGDVLVLPFTAYRAPPWNRGRPVLDPLGRYLEPNYLMSDVLVVDGRATSQDDPRAARAARALGLPTPRARATALRALGVRWVAAELDAGVRPRAVEGRTILDAGALRVQRLRGAVAPLPVWTGGQLGALALAWAAFVSCVVAGLVGAGRNAFAGIARRRPRLP